MGRKSNRESKQLQGGGGERRASPALPHQQLHVHFIFLFSHHISLMANFRKLSFEIYYCDLEFPSLPIVDWLKVHSWYLYDIHFFSHFLLLAGFQIIPDLVWDPKTPTALVRSENGYEGNALKAPQKQIRTIKTQT